jgi:hypothetical protein
MMSTQLLTTQGMKAHREHSAASAIQSGYDPAARLLRGPARGVGVSRSAGAISAINATLLGGCFSQRAAERGERLRLTSVTAS